MMSICNSAIITVWVPALQFSEVIYYDFGSKSKFAAQLGNCYSFVWGCFVFLYSGLMSSRLFLIQLPVSYVYCQREKQQQHLFRAYSKFQSIKEYYGELLLFMFVELYRFLQILIFCVKWHCAGLFPIRQSNSFKYCLTVVVAIDAGGKMKWLRYKKHRNAFSTPQKWIRVPQINSAPVGFSIVGR